MKKTFFLFLLLLTRGAQAQDVYQSAYDLFDDGQYRDALTQFEQLLAAQPDNSALLYNIGLCYHYLRQYQQAETVFSRLLSDPEYEYWATYQLALTDWRQGYYGAAEIGLTRVVLNSNDADLVELATLRYAELIENMPITSVKTSAWLGSVGIARGADNNIVDSRSLSASDQDDEFNDLSATVSHQWLQSDGNPNWDVQALIFTNRFDEIDSADLAVVSAGVTRYLYNAAWQFQIGLDLEQSTTGDADYLRQTSVNIRARSHYRNFKQGWHLTYQFADIEALSSEFRQLAGSSQLARIEYRIPLSDNGYWRLGAEWMNDDRNPVAINTLQSDLSADRLAIGTGLVALFSRWSFELGYDSRDSEYGDVLRTDGNLRIQRDDDRASWWLRADYNFAENWTVYAEHRDIHNGSNIPRFDYRQATTLFGMMWYF